MPAGEAELNPQTKTIIDTITQKLATLAASITGPGGALTTLTCPKGSECDRRQASDQLKGKLNAAKRNYQDAPLQLSLAEKNVYEYNDGDSGGDFIYTNTIVDRFAGTAQELRTNSIDKQQEFLANLTQALRQYQAQSLLLLRTKELLETRVKQNADLTQKIELFTRILQTNERKAVYEIKDTNNIYTFRRIMIFIYYAAVIGYIIFSNFIPDKLYMKFSVWMIIVIASIIPIILNMVMRWVFIIGDVIAYWIKNEMPHRDVYAELKDFNYTNTVSNVPPVPTYLTNAPSTTIHSNPVESIGDRKSGANIYNTLGVNSRG